MTLRSLPILLLFCASTHAQLQIKHVTEASGNTLDKALKVSSLIQPDAKPFTVKLTITQTKGAPGDYDASVEETWISPTQWVRKVTAKDLSQITVMNATGAHIVSAGEYFPERLRSFITALFNPVPDAEVWDRLRIPLTHIEFPNGVGSDPCMRQEFNLGVSPILQVNFANLCFKNGLLEMVQSSNYAMEFSNYQKFGKAKIARTFTSNQGHIALTGTIVSLEAAAKSDPSLFATPAGATDNDPLEVHRVGTDQLTKLAGGRINLPWPNPIPGQGMFTVWVSLDRQGVVREVHTLNTDESGFAYDMSQKMLGMRWKAPSLKGNAVQVEGALVFAYPPPPDAVEAKP